MKVRTSVLRGFALLALSTLTFAACDEKTTTEVPVQPVTVVVVPQSFELAVGETRHLIANVGNATNSAVTWSSTNSAVASVNATTGVVTAVSVGSAAITATSVQDPTKSNSASVVVRAAQAPVVTLTLVPEAQTLQFPGPTFQLVGIVGGTTNTTVNYTSSNTAVAMVGPTTGVVTPLSVGTTVITARSAADPTVFRTSVITVQSAPPGQQVQISITPTTASVQVQGTQQFVATVTNATNTAVLWRVLSGPATITATAGNVVTVRGDATGTAVIEARAAADTTRKVQAQLAVTPQAPPPSISIQSVTGAAVVGNTVAGQIIARINVSADVSHDVRRVEVRIDGQTVCTQTFSQPLGTTGGVAEINCAINTAELDSLGNPRFPNGTHILTAVAINGAGTVVAEATYPTLTFANPNTVTANITFTRQAVGTDGFLWRSGDATVRVIPQLFQGGTLAAVTVNLDRNCDGAAEAQATANTANNFTVVFLGDTATVGPTANDPLGQVTTNNACFWLGQAQSTAGLPVTLTPAGDQISNINLPLASRNLYRIDNVAPNAPATFNLPALSAGGARRACTNPPAEADRCWIGTGFMFTAATPASTVQQQNAATVVSFAASDVAPGSGVVSTEFFAVPTAEAVAQPNDSIAIAGRTAITGSADLPNTSSDQAYVLFVRVRDAVGNERITRGPIFGVDRETPSLNLTSTSPYNGMFNVHINASGGRVGTGAPLQFTFELQDNISDFPQEPIQVRMLRYYGAGAARCWNVNNKAILNPTDANLAQRGDSIPGASGCPFITLNGFSFDMTGLPEGYYEIGMRTTDRAGNPSPITTRTVLIDQTAPVVAVSSLVHNTTANSITISGTATDSVDLRASDLRLRFGALPSPTGTTAQSVLPVGPWDHFGSNSPASRIMSRSISGTLPVWRSVQDGVGGAVYNLDGAGIGAWDIARNFTQSFAGLSGVTGGAAPAALATFDISGPSGALTTGVNRQVGSGDWGTSVGSTSTSRTFTVTATGPAGTFARPFQTIHFYRVDMINGEVTYAGSTSSTVVTDDAVRTYTYEASLNWSMMLGGTYRVFAVGVTADGFALRSGTTGTFTVNGAYNPGN